MKLIWMRLFQATLVCLVFGAKDVGASDFLDAVQSGDTNTVSRLLLTGANVDETLSDGTAALVLAVASGHFELSIVLLEHGANPNAAAQGWTALHELAWWRDTLSPAERRRHTPSLELARALAMRGAEVDARQTTGRLDDKGVPRGFIGATPLGLAEKAKDLTLVLVLLELGADPAATGDAAMPLIAGPSK